VDNDSSRSLTIKCDVCSCFYLQFCHKCSELSEDIMAVFFIHKLCNRIDLFIYTSNVSFHSIISSCSKHRQARPSSFSRKAKLPILIQDTS